jgi:hypothetical protein
MMKNSKKVLQNQLVLIISITMVKFLDLSQLNSLYNTPQVWFLFDFNLSKNGAIFVKYSTTYLALLLLLFNGQPEDQAERFRLIYLLKHQFLNFLEHF